VTLTLSLLAAPLLATAQPRKNMPLVGFLRPGYPLHSPGSPSDIYLDAFRQGLRDLGYVEGQSLRLEVRYAEYQKEQYAALAAELVQLQPNVIVTNTTPALLAVKQATATIPIVMAVGGDLVELGLVASLARPGGNITGQILRDDELGGKRLELLKDAVPRISHVAFLIDPNMLRSAPGRSFFEPEARALGVQLQRVEAGTPAAISDALATIARRGVEALMIQDSSMFNAHRQQILDFALTQRLPTVCGVRAFAEAGCLIAYAPDILAMFERTAVFVDKILRGTPPGDLPMEPPHKLTLVVNLKTAEALGVTLPLPFLFRADEVIK
jgi:putative ABC transport system substrate-binding protein